MSRVGKNPIEIPSGVDVKIQGAQVTVKGPRGELSFECHAEMKITVKDSQLKVERPTDSKIHRSLHGTTRSIIANMISGTSSGYERGLQIIGVGYRAQVQGQKVTFTLGHSHPIEFLLPQGITAEVDKKQTQLTLRGIDKQLLGQVAANMRALRPPNVYKGKGVRYANEQVKLKVGKAAK